jgi:hypothetical protein
MLFKIVISKGSADQRRPAAATWERAMELGPVRWPASLKSNNARF